MYVLFTDTDNDITPSIAKEYGYNIISMPYSINGEDVYPYEDFEEFNGDEFYTLLRNGVIPKTCSVNYQRYIEYFEPFFKEGKDILYVHFSEKLSGTFSVMAKALEELKEKYPERKFYSI
ncbi:MAG: DegV family protein, partial [Clostridia bacterium]|nr:DegV family protein [Clostridia bacterium]